MLYNICRCMAKMPRIFFEELLFSLLFCFVYFYLSAVTQAFTEFLLMLWTNNSWFNLNFYAYQHVKLPKWLYVS